MCSPSQSAAVLPYGMKLHSPYMGLGAGVPPMSLELQRAQLQDYTNRLSLGVRSCGGPLGLGVYPYHSSLTNPYLHHYLYKDPRSRFIHEEPKPNHSYIGLIAMGILSHRDHKLVLSDIYQWILDNYAYFRNRGPGWRNSIRHNLSLNDCFIKSGRCANGKGHYWAIHPANIDDFQKGDFRRRRAQRRVRRHMGLSVPDDEDDSPVPSPQAPVVSWTDEAGNTEKDADKQCDDNRIDVVNRDINSIAESRDVIGECGLDLSKFSPVKRTKRTFDMDSLLAPDETDAVCKRFKNYRGTINAIGVDPTYTSSSEIIDIVHLKSESDEDKTSSIDTDVSQGEIHINTDSENEGSDRATKDVTDGEIEAGDPVKDAAEPGRRASAFRHTGTYGWGGLPGYISNYQLMALTAGQRSLLGSAPALTADSVQRWQQTMAQLAVHRHNSDQSFAGHVVADTHQ